MRTNTNNRFGLFNEPAAKTADGLKDAKQITALMCGVRNLSPLAGEFDYAGVNPELSNKVQEAFNSILKELEHLAKNNPTPSVKRFLANIQGEQANRQTENNSQQTESELPKVGA